MTDDGYNFEEPQIRELVRRNHEPEELILRTDDSVLRGSIHCLACGEPWPCPTLRSLREWTMERRPVHPSNG